jgi:parallel beta-helix repeat protein
VKTKVVAFSYIAILSISLFMLATINPTNATYSSGDTVVINSDGSVTPTSAPILREGNKYTLTDDVLMPSSTNEGIKVEADNIILNGAGHSVQGHGDSDAIYLEGRTGVTIQNFIVENFYWGLTLIDCTKCTIYGNNLSSIMYGLYLSNSSNNLIYHNNIYGRLYYQD